jgi:hypothetical protein
MDIFGFQFSYAPTTLSGAGAFALLAMLVATGAFVLAYLVGVIASIRIVTIRERRRAAAKKRKLRDLLAMKAAQDELDVELEREMHGIRPTSNLAELEILHEEVESASGVEIASASEEVAAQTVEPPIEQAEPASAEDASVPAMTVPEEAESEPIVAELIPASESVPAFSFAPAEPEPTSSAPLVSADESSVSSESSEPSVLAFSFTSAEPESADSSVPEPSSISAAEESAVPAESSPFSFSFAAAETEPVSALAADSQAAEPAPETASEVFGFSFATTETEPLSDSKSEEKKPKKTAEPEVEMSAFFKVG